MNRFYFRGFNAVLLWHFSLIFALLDKVHAEILTQYIALQCLENVDLNAVIKSQWDSAIVMK